MSDWLFNRSLLPLTLVVMLIVTPAWAADNPMPFSQAAMVPCKAYVASIGSEFYGTLLDAVVTRLMAIDKIGAFGSSCNVGEYVEKTCRAHPIFNVGQAIDDLVAKQRRGLRLPRIGQCGA